MLLLCGGLVLARDFKTHYDLALALYHAQKERESVPEFKAAYEMEPKPALPFNIAQAYRKAGQPREAIEYYDRYLAADPKLDSETRRRVDEYLAEACNMLAALELELKRRLAEEKAAQEPEPKRTPEPEPARAAAEPGPSPAAWCSAPCSAPRPGARRPWWTRVCRGPGSPSSGSEPWTVCRDTSSAWASPRTWRACPPAAGTTARCCCSS